MLAVEVESEPDHLSIADVEKIGTLRLNLFEPHSAGLAATSQTNEYVDALVVEFALARSDSAHGRSRRVCAGAFRRQSKGFQRFPVIPEELRVGDLALA
jgi:hypothetical protein